MVKCSYSVMMLHKVEQTTLSKTTRLTYKKELYTFGTAFMVELRTEIEMCTDPDNQNTFFMFVLNF